MIKQGKRGRDKQIRRKRWWFAYDIQVLLFSFLVYCLDHQIGLAHLHQKFLPLLSLFDAPNEFQQSTRLEVPKVFLAKHDSDRPLCVENVGRCVCVVVVVEGASQSTSVHVH